jgi:hypothetical protein
MNPTLTRARGRSRRGPGPGHAWTRVNAWTVQAIEIVGVVQVDQVTGDFCKSFLAARGRLVEHGSRAVRVAKNVF